MLPMRALHVALYSGCSAKPLEEGVDRDPSGVLDRQVPEVLGDFAEDGHLVVEREVPEEERPRLEDVHVVLEKPFFIQVRLVDLALRSILFDEPVVTERLRIL